MSETLPNDTMPARCEPPQVYDDHAVQIVHLRIGRRVFHAAVAGDAYSATCLETGLRVRGQSRQDTLKNLLDALTRQLDELAWDDATLSWQPLDDALHPAG